MSIPVYVTLSNPIGMVLEDDSIGMHEPEDPSLNFLTRLMTSIVKIMMMSTMNRTPMMISTVLIGLGEAEC